MAHAEEMVSLICFTHKSNIRSESGVCITETWHLLALKKLHVNHSLDPSSSPSYSQDAGTK